MKKLFIILLVVFIVASFGVALAGNDKPKNTNPCDKGKGHPAYNFEKQGDKKDGHPNEDRCEGDDEDADEADDVGDGHEDADEADDSADEADDGDADEADDSTADDSADDSTTDVDADVDADLDADGAVNLCTAADGDPGLLTTDTLGQTLWDGGLSALSPLTEDPERNGIISGPLGAAFTGTPLEVVGDEVACLIDLLLDETVSPIDL